METVKGKILRILYKNDENKYVVFIIRTNSDKNIVVTGEFEKEIIPELVADFHGEFTTHPKYGSQFRAYSHEVSFNKSDSASIQLFLNTVANWIGPERSNAIVSFFGEDTIRILDEEPQRLLEVPGIGDISAKSIEEAWQKCREDWKTSKEIYSVRVFLHSMGLKEKRVKRIIRHLGVTKVEEKLKENPYILTEITGFGFSTADFIAKNLGVPESSPNRLESFILYTIKEICPSEGHLFYTKEELAQSANKYIQDSDSKFIGKEIIEITDLDDPIKILVDKGILISDCGRLYSKLSHEYETRSASLLTHIMTKESDLIFLNKDSIEDHIDNFERENQITLSEEQREALFSFAKEKVLVITGGPGTGKTTLLKAVVEIINKQGLSLTPLTPTGISAKKLASTIGSEASTIHRKLGFRGNGTWIHNENNLYKTDVIILDESSMIDQEVLFRLLSSIEKRVHLLFVGDHNQLPSVGAGNVLRELIGSNSIPVVRLEKIFRQKEASGIIKVAHKIKDGEVCMDLFSPNPTDDVFFIRKTEVSEIEKIVVALAQKFKGEKRLFQIITPRNDGPLSIESLNILLQAILNPPNPLLSEVKFGNRTLIRSGDRVIITKNDYERDIFNGDIGKVTAINKGIISIQIDLKTVDMGVEEAEDKIKLAYAITVHKCVPSYNKIATNKGYTPIGKLSVGNRVLSGKSNSKKILWQGNTGKRRICRIETVHGYRVDSSEEHSFLIADKEGEKFKKARDLSIFEDYACIKREVISGEDIKTQFINSRGRGPAPKKIINFQNYLTPQMSWFIGSIIGDGCYTDRRDGTVEITQPSCLGVLREFKKISLSLGMGVGDHLKNGKLKGHYVISKNFRDWLFSIGLDYVKAPKKIIPDLIFRSNVSCRRATIAGLFDTDGSINKEGLIRFTTASEKLALNLQLLLLSVGILSSRSLVNKKYFCLTINKEDLGLFKNTIPLKNEKRRGNLCRYKYKSKNTTYKKIPYGRRLVVNFLSSLDTSKTGGRLGAGINSSKYKKLGRYLSLIKRGGGVLTYLTLSRMIKFLKNQNKKIPQELLNISSNNIFYDKIKKITFLEEETDMRDIEVAVDNSYITDGFICHNSQGLEYPIVIIPFIRQYGRNMLQRNLLYTAITRAKEKVIILGHGSAIEKAIQNTSVIKRNTILGDRIKQCLLQKKNASLQPQL